MLAKQEKNPISLNLSNIFAIFSLNPSVFNLRLSHQQLIRLVQSEPPGLSAMSTTNTEDALRRHNAYGKLIMTAEEHFTLKRKRKKDHREQKWLISSFWLLANCEQSEGMTQKWLVENRHGPVWDSHCMVISANIKKKKDRFMVFTQKCKQKKFQLCWAQNSKLIFIQLKSLFPIGNGASIHQKMTKHKERINFNKESKEV